MVLAAILVMGGGNPIAQAPTFRATTELVPIYATVRGPDGRLLPDLKDADFEILDNGRPQTIRVFSRDPVPITGVALWDVSPSMASSIDRLRAAARAFVSAIWPDDRIRFGSFSEEIAFSPLVTNDKSTLHRIVEEEIWPGYSRSPVWTAMLTGLRLLAGESGRRVLVVVSDGEAAELASTKQDVERHLQQIDCLVYAVGLEGHGFSAALRDIADISGGGFRVLKKTAPVDDEFMAIVTELHHQYLIGFVPEALDGTPHSLTVRVNIPGATVRARKAYIAAPRLPAP
jgi:VWFA-related protein